MVNPHDASEILNAHFKQISLDEFNERHDKYVGEEPSALVPIGAVSEPSAIVLHQPEAAHLRLTAYLASALTGLSQEQREHVDAVSDIAESVCHNSDIELYQPKNATDPVHHPGVSSSDVFNLDRERVLRSDLVVHIADYASTGSGEELNFALNALIPIVLIARGDSRVSRMVTGIPALKLVIRYEDFDQLSEELQERLIEIRPVLEERKLVFSDFDKNMVGTKVRVLRESLGLTREDMALQLDKLLPVERIRQIEGNLDSLSNPSLVELRYLAAVLKTTVADLVEPDLSERMIAFLQGLMLGRIEARYGMSSRDQKQLMRHMLYRVLQNLDRD